jgi:hypothetical protein
VKIRRKKCGGIKFRLGFIEVYQWRWPWPTGSAYPKFVPMVFSSTNLFVRPGDTDEGRGSQTSWQSLDHATADVNGRRCTEKYKKILVNGQPAGVDIEKTRRKKSCDINFPPRVHWGFTGGAGKRRRIRPPNCPPRNVPMEFNSTNPVEGGRGGRIRTSGLLDPNQALYQAEPRPDEGKIPSLNRGFETARNLDETHSPV